MERLADVLDLRSVDPDLEDYSDEELGYLLESASDLIQGYVGFDFSDPVPSRVKRLTLQLVQRAIRQDGWVGEVVPHGASNMSNTAGPYTQSFGFSPGSNDGGVWLNRQDKTVLRRYKGMAFTVRTW